MSSKDFVINHEGSISLLYPITQSAKDWVEYNIGEDNSYQPMYPNIVIEHRYVEDVLCGIIQDGLTVEQ